MLEHFGTFLCDLVSHMFLNGEPSVSWRLELGNGVRGALVSEKGPVWHRCAQRNFLCLVPWNRELVSVGRHGLRKQISVIGALDSESFWASSA